MNNIQARIECERQKIDRELEMLYAASLDDELDEEELYYIEEDIRYLKEQKALMNL